MSACTLFLLPCTYSSIHTVYGVVQDAVIMLLGAVMLAVATGTTINGWVIMYAISQLVYGVGVGGK